MNIDDTLRILKNGAENAKDDSSDYMKGKRDGEVRAYSHAWTEVKNLSAAIVSKSIAKEYAQFCVRCDREGLPLLELDDYINEYFRKTNEL